MRATRLESRRAAPTPPPILYTYVPPRAVSYLLPHAHTRRLVPAPRARCAPERQPAVLSARVLTGSGGLGVRRAARPPWSPRRALSAAPTAYPPATFVDVRACSSPPCVDRRAHGLAGARAQGSWTLEGRGAETREVMMGLMGRLMRGRRDHVGSLSRRRWRCGRRGR